MSDDNTQIIEFEDIQVGDEIALESESGGVKTSRTLTVEATEIYRERYVGVRAAYSNPVTTHRKVKAVDGSWTSIGDGESIRLVKRDDLVALISGAVDLRGVIGPSTLCGRLTSALESQGLKVVRA